MGMQKELKILLLSSVFLNLAAGLFGPLYAIFVQEIGGNLTVAGFAYSIYAITTGVLIFFISKWEDRFQHEGKLIALGRFLAVIGFVGYLFVNKPTDLYILQLVFALSGAITYPAVTSFYSKHLDKGKFASEWGIWGSAVWIVIGIAAIIGGHLANNYGFNLIFMIMAGLSFISFLVSLVLLKKEYDLGKAHEKVLKDHLRAIKNSRKK